MISKTILKSQPSLCGVYTFWQGDDPIYIGKAINLKARLISHMRTSALDQKEYKIIHDADRITTIETNSEFNALILEAQLIKKYRPKYNVIWRDDKSYLYIKITIKDEYPKVWTVRQENDNKSLYFGPFGSQRVAQSLLHDVRKIIPYCTQRTLSLRPCFYSKIGLCNPCPNSIERIKKIDLDEGKKLKRIYRSNIQKIIRLLKGNAYPILASLEKKLNAATKGESYEVAIPLRNKLFSLSTMISHTSFDHSINVDLNVDSQLGELAGEASYFFEKYFNRKYDNPILRFECFDISNLMGLHATASLVVFTDGKPDKKLYRKFKIKTVKQISDFWMMREALTRRFTHIEWPDPLLLIVDGGKPQIRIAKKVLYDTGKDIPLVGIAKNPDRIILATTLKTIPFANTSLLFQTIRYLRDESHRFAKKYHLQLRDVNR